MPLGPSSKAQSNTQDLTRADSKAVLERCAELDAEVNALKAKYDQYFLGMEKLEPRKQREDLKKRLLDLKASSVRNTSAKFKVATLVQKFLTYERLWLKTAKEVEEGTYRGELFMARHRAKVAGKPALAASRPARSDRETTDPDFDVDEELPPEPAAKAPAKPPPPPPPPVAAARPAAPPGLSDERVKAIYDTYITAKLKCNESTAGITYESVAASIRSQVPQIMRQYKAKGVDFKVVIKDGRTILKAVPKV